MVHSPFLVISPVNNWWICHSEFFKAITNKINENCETYRLFGPKIGIILEDNKDYKEIVSFL